jgi:hypothetical protein
MAAIEKGFENRLQKLNSNFKAIENNEIVARENLYKIKKKS